MSLKSLNTTSSFYAASFDPISQEAEHDLAIRMINGESQARDTLIRSNLRYAIKEAAKYKYVGLDYEDKVSIAISGLINGIGSIAGAIGDLLGQDWSFSMPTQAPRIPKLATGGIVNSATMALIGESGKEAVLPLENNTGWMDMLADKIAARNSAPSKIVLQLDGKELGWANINSINNITAQTGSLQLVLA